MKKHTFSFLAAFLLLSVSGFSAHAQHIITLEESKQLALKNNIDVRTATLEYKAARQVRKSALTNYFPKVEATGVALWATDPMLNYEVEGGNLPVYDGNPMNLMTPTQFAYFPGLSLHLLDQLYTGAVTAVQPIFAGGRIINGNRLAGVGVDAKEYQVELARSEALVTTEQKYSQLVALEGKYKTAQAYKTLLEQMERQVRDATESGITLRNDLLKVQLKLSELQLNITRLEHGKKLAMMSFCQYIGIPYDSTLNVETQDMLVEDPMPQKTNHKDALLDRNEYKLLNLSVDAANLQKRMELGKHLPSLAVGVGGYYLEMDDLESETNTMAFATVSIPISDWWGGGHSIAEKSIKEDIAKQTRDNTSELLLLQMDKAWYDVVEAREQVRTSRLAQSQAQENVKLNRDSYENGVSSLSDLLEAEALLQDANNQLIDAVSAYRVAILEYYKATGTL